MEINKSSIRKMAFNVRCITVNEPTRGVDVGAKSEISKNERIISKGITIILPLLISKKLHIFLTG